MKFSEEIINILDYLCKKFGVVIDWTSENVMPYLEDLCARYIQYEVFTSIAWMIIVPAVTLIIAIPLAITHKKAKAVNWNDYESFTPIIATILWIVFAVMALASVAVIGVQVFDIIECYTLPEKVILEYLKTLMDSAK
jgi:hypothetical protein